MAALELSMYGKGKANPYKSAHWRHLTTDLEARLNVAEAKLQAAFGEMTLAGFRAGDWLQHIEVAIAEGATIATFPPFYKGGYEAMFRWLDQHTQWDRPAYQVFDPAALQELADSIVAQGLIQPITVTPRGDRYLIVAGERRWRAHKLAGLTEIEANVREMDDQAVMLQAIIENAVRRDVSPLEEAVAYQRCLDMGLSVDELAKRLGMAQAWRITERTCLLSLRPEYQQLLKAKQLTHSQAYEMAQLSPAGQDRLFKAIRVGECSSYDQLRTAALAIRESEKQGSFFGDDDAPTETEKRLAKGLESRVQKVIQVLRASTVDNEVVAVRKISPDRASTLADMFAAMRGEIDRIEAALRAAGQPAIV